MDDAVPEAQGGAVEHEPVQDQVQGWQKRLHKQEEQNAQREAGAGTPGQPHRQPHEASHLTELVAEPQDSTYVCHEHPPLHARTRTWLST